VLTPNFIPIYSAIHRGVPGGEREFKAHPDIAAKTEIYQETQRDITASAVSSVVGMGSRQRFLVDPFGWRNSKRATGTISELVQSCDTFTKFIFHFFNIFTMCPLLRISDQPC
jgi:hypothetical protein